MGTRILYIDPICSDEDIGLFASEFNQIVDSITTVDVVSIGNKPGPLHLEYNCYEVMVMPDIVRIVKQAEAAGYDAAIIGCFYDPALRACREISSKMSIVAPAEASLHIATTLGECVSIIVGRQKWIPEIKENVHKYGFSHKLASIKPLEMGVLDFQQDHQQTMNRIRAAAREAIERDGADIIVLGCTAELGFYRQLQDELGVPVIDVSLASVKYAEFLVNIKKNMSWSHSKKVGYQSPPEHEQKAFRLFP
ncbi:aspartate/glutamate racemase family protein [Brevibacillus centrosporus]|uniref:Allantoin racemase n=1 Tax=Brevibacillus centrosporus TaxID=54910 RepID=A0A1I3LJN0_9BACL|nr:aspartate/glutamate racemase family protein [Brevibacillus centrosporus]MEC2131399.1 aspartate/glutamate racemase family protein [Brevibacillus centrosporus]MED4906925.1 aspartate/glutamate racemase family protein [Brevibacillus centrosporus]RNB72576.1 hydantoin racemase [Brevibacillus centrosporus]SFI84686.1 allantoin racemase [Brevibacillus centrosporus]GED31612.1 hydantoin racemase [Brevibacillus centrosporus]